MSSFGNLLPVNVLRFVQDEAPEINLKNGRRAGGEGCTRSQLFAVPSTIILFVKWSLNKLTFYMKTNTSRNGAQALSSFSHWCNMEGGKMTSVERAT